MQPSQPHRVPQQPNSLSSGRIFTALPPPHNDHGPPRARDIDLEPQDDDLEILECTPPPQSTKSSSMADASINTSKTSKRKSMDDGKLNEGEEDVDGKGKSKVWKYFEDPIIVDGIRKCKCKRCTKLYTCDPKSGTSHLRRHVIKCYKTPQFHDIGSLLGGQSEIANKWKFDSKASRDAISKAVILHDLPFSYAEYEGIHDANKILNPQFKRVSRNTLKADCKKIFFSEKIKLKSELISIRGRICLTSDVWTAVTTKGYMSVTAHYVDENWRLNSKLLAFCFLENQHTGVELSGKVLEVLKDWGIESKIFSITLDNASNNNAMERHLQDRLNLRNGLLCNGEFFRVRCCAHVLNIIVKDGLKATGIAVDKVRGSVKYVKASDSRLRSFQKCIEEAKLNNVGGSFLRLDVTTRWNSTYMMLESAIKYRHAFSILNYNDDNYVLCPTEEEWKRAERVCTFLAPFYHITNLISGSSYPTSNLYFMQVASIEMNLNESLSCEDEVIREMAKEMKTKFKKYWEDYCVILALGSVVDPTAKLQFLNFCYMRLYPFGYEKKVDIVKEALYKLFDEYERNEIASRSSIPRSSEGRALLNSQHPMQSGLSTSSKASILDEYHEEMRRQMNSNEGKSELDIYLGEPCMVGNDINVLEYWRMNNHRFPQLATMACDILSIPITTVASESTFSIGARILNKYRNCLLPENVQALICTRSWLHGFKDIGPSDFIDVLKMEEVRVLSNEGSNDLDE